MKKKSPFLLTLLFVALLLVGTTTSALAQSDYTVMTANNPTLGNILVDGQGRTLYYFTNDAPGVSSTKGQVAINWPAFYTAKIDVPMGLTASDFGMITREDGMMQTTFRGWPLYYFKQDMMAGDVKGQKVNNVWFVVGVN